MMLRISPAEEKFGCLFGLLGALIGPLVVLHGCETATKRLQSIDPDILVCGFAVVGPMLGGAIIGGLAGAVGGMVLWRLIRWCCRRPTQA
jgi:hypothetical protein